MPRPITVAATIVAVLALGACGNSDASEDDVHDILTEAGASEEQADCAAGDIVDELSQDELNDLASADQPEDIPDKINEKITPILDNCLAEGGPVEEDEGDTSDSTVPEGSSDTSDTTATTATDGAAVTTTTTVAP